MAYLVEQQTRLADQRDQYPGLRNVPIHVEEWGETSGGTKGVDVQPKADVRNSEYGAAFLVAWVGRHIRLRQENDRNITAFTFCASGYEKPPAKDFMGYRTLHTKNGFHKPLLNAYRLLERVADELVKVEGCPADVPVTAFAARDAEKLTLVLVNYQHDQIEGNGAAFDLCLKVKTAWAPDVKLEVRHWRIDRAHSNAYTVFKELGAPENPSDAEIEAIKKRMGLELLEPVSLVPACDLKAMTVRLPCNAVSLLEFCVSKR